jgi:hypothetical protein
MGTFQPLTDEEITFYTLKCGEYIYPDWETYKRAIPALVRGGKFMVMCPNNRYSGTVRRIWIGPRGMDECPFGVIPNELESGWFNIDVDDPLIVWLLENNYIEGTYASG